MSEEKRWSPERAVLVWGTVSALLWLGAIKTWLWAFSS